MEDTAGRSPSDRNLTCLKGLGEARVSGTDEKSADVSPENSEMNVGMEVRWHRLCEPQKALAFTLSDMGALRGCKLRSGVICAAVGGQSVGSKSGSETRFKIVAIKVREDSDLAHRCGKKCSTNKTC